MKKLTRLVPLTLGPVAAIALTAGMASGQVVNGGPENDKLYGTEQADTMSGFAGWDWFDGKGGDDVIYGNNGLDTIHGGTGKDVLRGGYGDDLILDYGGDADRLVGGPDDDTLGGYGGPDRMIAGDGHDDIHVSETISAPDYIDCGPGYDWVWTTFGKVDANDTFVNCERVVDQYGDEGETPADW